ncbi:hypothetical protein KR50_10090 [Jeotgalibacillus campisalis]|uniref:Uncharacterized protein n=1 Tax=Jeotgalibacillus campisalis TaxID=220754 RepID=A0A0C2W535_9BACL|nr:hypothetical protein KR50_10090 [Jeotgalibacillus campisalis]
MLSHLRRNQGILFYVSQFRPAGCLIGVNCLAFPELVFKISAVAHN